MPEKLIKRLANNKATVSEQAEAANQGFNGFICDMQCDKAGVFRIQSVQGNSTLARKFHKGEFADGTIAELCGKKVAREVQPYLERAMAGEHSEAEIFQNQRQYLCIFSPLAGASRKTRTPANLQCVAIDITSQQDSIKAARRANKYITGIFNALNSSTIVSITDRRGQIIMANDMFCKISGYSQHELLGENHRIVNSGFHNKAFWRDMWQTISKGHTWRAEVCNRKKTGELYWVDTVVHPLFSLDEPGLISQYLSLRTVITGRKQLEQELSRKNTLLHQMGIMSRTGGWEVDFSTKEILCTDSLRLLMGLRANECITFRKAFAILQPSVRREIRNIVKEATRLKTSFDTEITYTRLDKAEGFARITGVPEFFGNELSGFSGAFQDITEFRLSEQKIREASQKVAAAGKARSEFLSRMSHEIRTPLNIISGITQLLMQTGASEEQMKFLQTMKNSEEHLMSLVNRVLDFSKIESGKSELELTPVNIADLVSNICDTLRVKVSMGEISLLPQIDKDMPPFVMTDKLRLNQILSNLVSNAIKFTEHGSVTVAAQIVEKRKSWVRIQFNITDTGIGMTDSEIERIFDGFTQANATIARKFGGTGLGLSITRELLKLMNSEISVDSQPGKGTSFYFTLDCAIPEKTELLKAQSDSGAASPDHDLAHAKILIVDDNEVNLMIAEKFIVSWGAIPFTATNGISALEIFEAHKPDLILLDLQMPEIDGYETARRIRKHNWVTPIIALTADALPESEALARDAGMNDIIIKPFTASQLKARIHKYLR